MRSLAVTIALLAAVSCSPAADRGAVMSGRAVIVLPDEGNRLFLCSAPEIGITIKIDSASAGLSHFAMGTGDLDGANDGVHQDFDEVIFVYGGTGMVFVGSDTARAELGTTMYVPRGIRHGFASDTGGVMSFAWMIVPQNLPRSFVERGVSSLEECDETSDNDQ